MVEERENIKKFLLDVYGYEKIYEWINKGKKDKGETLREFLEGTIIGTFSLIYEGIFQKMKVNYPYISTIKEKKDLELDMIFGFKREDLDYKIYNSNYFYDYNSDKCLEFLENRIMPLFPYALFEKFKEGVNWRYEINYPNFRLGLRGSYKKNRKHLHVEFNP